jgi:hypothetical protein
MRMHSDGSFDDEELVREGGVFVSRGGGREVGPADEDRTPGDYAQDRDADDGVPGTRDDLPYDFGVETTEAADHVINGPDNVNAGFGGMGSTGSDGDRGESPLGAADERELWNKQLSLIEESDAEEAHLIGLDEADARRIRDAEAEGAEDPLPDSPEGESATGAT